MTVMSLLERTKLLLRRHRIFPKKRLGQNFMVEPSIFQCMAKYASLSQDDVVLDIGAGLGFLTRFLADKCKYVLAVESDSRLVSFLHAELRDLPNVELIEGDVLNVQMSQFNKVISVPPYYFSSSLLLWLFNKNFECGVLIFQKEFVNRLVASVGSEDYGWLTVVAYYHAEVELFDEIPKWMFYPQPEVSSIIVRLELKKRPPFTLKDKVLFKQLVQTLFTQRNRKVRNAVLPFMKSKHVTTAENVVELADSLPFHDKRVRELAPEDFGALANALAK
jgi:16S rRNA (adenine1518-N6/adenine1519-N6)-dimethyltransferase